MYCYYARIKGSIVRRGKWIPLDNEELLLSERVPHIFFIMEKYRITENSAALPSYATNFTMIVTASVFVTFVYHINK